MKIDLFDVKEFIEVNHLKEVTSHVLMQRGDIPDPDGLISTEIFGSTTKSRKETFAYIDLHGYFFHPHIYVALKRMYRNIDKIINGEMYVSLSKEGYLKEDNENGETGLDFLYNNWEKIRWEDSESLIRTERINLITKFKKNEVFMHYQLVIPAFYRDVKSMQSGSGETDDINNLYASLIRMSKMLAQSGYFDWQLDITKYNIQQKLVEVYNYFKNKLEKKNGVIRKYLMGKNVDYCTRTVITAPTYHANSPEDLLVDFEHASLPLSQVCSLVYPFMLHYLKNFFEQNVIDNKFSKILYNPVTDTIEDTVQIKDPELVFTDRYIKKMIDLYIRDPESRFNKIEVPTNTNKKLYLAFSGMRLDSTTRAELGIVNRPMTWTDLLYMAAEEVCRDKHCIITRYPVLNEFGVFISKFRVASTVKTEPISVNGYLYKWYPVINFDVPKDRIGSLFNDATNFSNAYLDGLDGD